MNLKRKGVLYRLSNLNPVRTFDVLRVKVLSAEGAHKKVSTPKYDKSAFSVSHSLMSGILHKPENYGVRISTLMDMVDKGDI